MSLYYSDIKLIYSSLPYVCSAWFLDGKYINFLNQACVAKGQAHVAKRVHLVS